MAYSGSTAASSVARPPMKIGGALGGYSNTASTGTPIGMGLWLFATTDTSSGAFTAGYFSDGYELGMKQGDVVIISHLGSTVSSSQVLTIGIISSVSSTGGGTQCSTFSFLSST